MLKLAVKRIRAVDLNTSRSLAVASVLVPIFFGIVSLFLGQDSNWDLQNYHFYNAFAVLNNKLSTDLAPAQMQTYFNPLLDLPYYAMTLHWPAPLVGFTMGVIHGLNFVLLLGIASKAIPDFQQEDRHRIPLLLAVAGCLTGNFLSEVGNTMGDNTTALFVLASLLIVLWNWNSLLEWSWTTAIVVSAAGVVAGLGAGLKLTNGIYAMALAMSFLVVPLNWAARLRLGFIFAVSVLFGLALTGGYWFLEMWRHFGNPLFPQFGKIFQNPLAQPILVADTSWLPKDWIEATLWPFIFSLDSRRVGQVRVFQIIWPMLYLLFGWWSVSGLQAKLRGTKWALPNRASLFLLCFVAVAYLLWMKAFSIYRYFVSIEMLGPIAILTLLMQLLSYHRARRVAAWILSAAVAVVVLGGTQTWGHEPWGNTAFRVNTPVLSDPAATTVLLLADPPYAFVAPFFPLTVSFVGVGTNFPETPEYVSRIHAMVASRSGPVYALLKAHTNEQIDHIAKMNSISKWLGLGCEKQRWIADHTRSHATVRESGGPTTDCEFALLPEDHVDLAEKNRATAIQATRTLQQYGFTPDQSACQTYDAFIGNRLRPFQLCRLHYSPR